VAIQDGAREQGVMLFQGVKVTALTYLGQGLSWLGGEGGGVQGDASGDQ